MFVCLILNNFWNVCRPYDIWFIYPTTLLFIWGGCLFDHLRYSYLRPWKFANSSKLVGVTMVATVERDVNKPVQMQAPMPSVPRETYSPCTAITANVELRIPVHLSQWCLDIHPLVVPSGIYIFCLYSCLFPNEGSCINITPKSTGRCCHCAGAPCYPRWHHGHWKRQHYWC